MPTDPPGEDVIRQAVDYAMAVTGKIIRPEHPLHAACFAEVLRARLAYEYALCQVPGA